MNQLTDRSFDLERSLQVLERTPAVISVLLLDLDDFWTASRSDESDWEPFDIVGHLIHGEKTDWMPRARQILSASEDKTFSPFDRVAQFELSAGRPLASLIDEFSQLRSANLAELRDWHLGADQLGMLGNHPELGPVTLMELISTWVVHDLNHIRQVCERLAMKYRSEVGPWRAYLSILK